MQVKVCAAFHINREDTKDEAYEDISKRGGDGIGDNFRVDVVTMNPISH